MNSEQSQVEESPHRLLARLAGTWAGTMRTWLEPGGVPHEAPVHASIQLILDGRFALYLYQSSIQSEPQHGLFTIGFNTVLNRYEASWIDSYHNNTAIMSCSGGPIEGGLQVQGVYPDPVGGPDWSWRTEFTLESDDRLVLRAYNISPDGLESRAIVAELDRARKSGA